jgi:hypothetical protein
MDTKPLERFATWARRELINAVDAQATAVLAVGSVARSERAQVIRKLEAEIERHGRQHVVDKVAYTWFNRIIALRFMDARGYTDAAIVSPAQGQENGQPEILADAKRGNLDTDVVTNPRTATAIIGLLDGTRRSTDVEGEAYALLLTEYCRYWHKPMPFLFEREGDYTELLVPANLLADGAILARARKVLSADVCDDVEVIGWLYQFYISERKNEVFAGFKSNAKAGPDEIPAATQLFTPHWIVRYLLENSVGRLWMLNHPTSGLVNQMDYYIPSLNEETDFLKISGPEDLTVIDPACGSGHMLTYAFDLLYAIYEEQGYAPADIPGLVLTHNLQGTEIDPRAAALAAFALTMKARAKQRSFFDKRIAPRICVIEPILFHPDELDLLVSDDGDQADQEDFWQQFEYADTLGSLIHPDASSVRNAAVALERVDADVDILYSDTIARARAFLRQAEALSRSYAVVVANPPYMGSKNMDARLAAFAKKHFPDAKGDLMTMFMVRASQLSLTQGWWGMINLPSWMSLSGSEKLRDWLLKTGSIDTMLHFGRGVFGSDFGSVGFVVENTAPTPHRRGVYRKLFDKHVEVRSTSAIETLFRDESYQRYEVAQKDLSGIPGSPIVYWLSPAMRAAFALGRPLGELAELREGISTGDNETFMRMWWEVASSRSAFRCSSGDEAESTGAKWFPFNKGGAFRKWYGNQEYVVNWEHDGAAIRNYGVTDGGRPRSRAQNTQFFFLPSLSWSKISSGDVSFRTYPEGFTFASAAKSIYSDSERDSTLIMSICNSSLAQTLLAAKSPTMSFLADDIGSLPTLLGDLPEETIPAIAALTATSRLDWDSFETSANFGSHPLLTASGSQLAERAQQLFEAWGASASEQQQREAENNRVVAETYGLDGEVQIQVPLHRISLTRNVEFRYGPGKTRVEYAALERADLAAELISYAVGCMFGRYSVDVPGLILADQGATSQDYLATVSMPTFATDADNVLPILADDRFDDDIVDRVRQFLRTAFGDERFEENLNFVEEALGVKTLRDYFITKSGVSKFYADHVQRYKRRPIYWMFSSPRGSFNALIYMHRYTPSTVSIVLNEYLREYRAKLEVALSDAEQAAAGGDSKVLKEADRLRKVLVELAEYEHDVLYPLATQQIAIDLDDGVKANYPKFYPALKSIAGLEDAE